MNRKVFLSIAVTGIIVCAAGQAAFGAVAIVIEHQWTVANNYFSAFAYNYTDPTEFRTTGYGGGRDLRWSRVLDDSVEPWTMEGGTLIDSFQYEIFARNGFAADSASISIWGMNFSPLDETYFLTTIGKLRGYDTGKVRLDEERDMIKHFPGLPDSPTTMPTNCSVSNFDGDYFLTDDNLTSSNGFIASGVQPGHRVTMFPIDVWAEVYAQSYLITEVVSDTVVRVDENPTYSGSHIANDIGYLLSIQPHLTLGTFRQNIPYFSENTTTGPKAHYKGGMSPDGTTLYIGEIISDNLIAVDTLVPEQFTIFVSQQTLHDYVLAQNDSGRIHMIVNHDRAYADGSSLVSGWKNKSTDTILAYKVTDPAAAVGTKCLGVTFNAAGAQVKFNAEYDYDDGEEPRIPSDYTHMRFWTHGGTSGGQQMAVSLCDTNGVTGNVIAVTPPLVGEWTLVEIPIGEFGVSTIGDIVFDNTAGASQPIFYMDDIGFAWVDPLPPGVGAFDTNGAGMAAAQVDCDADGRVWFSEVETDDILWTTNGVDLNVFLRSDEIATAYIAADALDSTLYTKPSNAVQVMGLIVDEYGAVYWSDNQTNSIWRASAVNPADHITEIATKDQIKTALNLGTHSPRGLNCFTIRGKELLTFNYVDSNTVFKVDINTSGAELIESFPEHEQTLWRTANNFIRLTFDIDITAPADGELLIEVMNSNGAFGTSYSIATDTSADFHVEVTTNGSGNSCILEIWENGTVLTHTDWIAVHNTGSWNGVAEFHRHYPVIKGDVDGDGDVLPTDFGPMFPKIPTFGSAPEERADVDGNRDVLPTDFGPMFPQIPTFGMHYPKPGGHLP